MSNKLRRQRDESLPMRQMIRCGFGTKAPWKTGECGTFRGQRDRRCSPSIGWKKAHRSRCVEHRSFTRKGKRYVPGKPVSA